MSKILKCLAVVSAFIFAVSVYALAVEVPVSNQSELNAAIAGSESDLLITSQDLNVNTATSISAYPSLYIHAASTPSAFTASGGSDIFTITDSAVNFKDIGFKDISGAVFINADNSVLGFENAFFKNNNSGVNDSAFILTNRSNASFNGQTEFTGNTGSFGGGFHAAGSELNFNGNTVFANNSAQSGGGFFSNMYFDLNVFEIVMATVNFNGAVEFTSNTATAASGGAFTAMASNVNFTNSATFKYNRASTDGGAGLISGSAVIFSSPSVFEQNRAGGNGGALYVTTLGSAEFAQKASFTGNVAGGSGGAVYIFDSNITLQNASFTGNKAAVNGGAVFVRGDADFDSYAQLNINTVNNGVTDNKTVFQGNLAAGVPNALYLGELSTTIFTTALGASVEMYDGIKSDTDTAFMVVKGAGNFNLYANADIYNLDLQSANFNLKNANSITVNNFTADQNSVLNMKNSSNSNSLNVVNFDFDGLLKLDGGSGEGADGDNVIAVNANLGSNSKLDVKTDAAVDSSMNYRKRIYKVLNYQSLTGSFSLVTANEGLSLASLSVNSATAVAYGADWLTITLEGLNQSTDFSGISGLSYNQKQTAKTFDKLSSQTLSLDLDEQISDIDAMANDDLKKSALLDVSGYFLANVIRSAASENERQDIYSKIRYHDMDKHNLNGLWAQGRVQSSELDGNDNSKDKFEDLETGVLAGWDIMLDEQNIALGVYGKYNKHDIKQGSKSKAAIEGAGAGIYGGYLKDDWELKGVISGDFDNFSTERNISYVSRTAEADFSAMTLGADFEGAIRTYVTESVLLRPFAGIEFKNTNYDAFNEKGAGDLSLQVDGNNYFRSAARIGLSVGSDDGAVVEWYAGVEGKYLLTEEEPAIDAAFMSTSEVFSSKGSKEGTTMIGMNAGGAYKITENFKVFANASYQSAEGYMNIYGNAGVRYMFLGSGN